MNPIAFALRRPITMLVGLVALIGAGGIAIDSMKVDIFPSLNLPVVYVAQPYGGMDPKQMEGLIANYYEYHFLYIGGIHHVESRNAQGLSLMKLYFHPGTDMAQAMAETVGYVNRSRAFMPPGTVPPFIMRFDTGSVPVGYLVLSSETKTIAQIQDQALFKVRPMFAALPGVSAPPPFGGNQRTIVIRADPQRLNATGISGNDLVNAVAQGNSITPSGNIRETERMPFVPVNTMAVRPKDFGDIPVKRNVFVRDLVMRNPGTQAPLIEDASDIPTGYALVNGKRAVYILATKRADASTLDVVANIKNNLPKMQAALPSDIKVSFEFDQSPYVTNAVWGVGTEAALGAFLTGLMVLLFLRDWRSVIVVVLNIPLALIASVAALWLTDMLVAKQTINLMTLGGLALAVGILVDEATVEVENIHTQFDKTDSIALAVRRGNSETAVPRFLAMLCVLAVFLPSFLMEGSAKALFVPLSLAVGFAMIGSYILSSTFVPVASIWLLRKAHGHTGREPWLSQAIRPLAGFMTAARWLVVPIYFALAAVILVASYLPLGKEIFPQVDSGQFQFRLKAPTGTRIEQTEQIVQKALEMIKEEFGADSISISLGYVGVVPSSYPINAVYLFTGGPEEAVMRVAMKPGVVRISEAKSRLREKLTRELPNWLEQKWLREGVPEARARKAHDLKLSFEPADIINEVMSFGSPTPVEIQVSGSNINADRAYAAKLRAELEKIPGLKDLQYVQSQDYPTLEVKVDRRKAALSDLQAGVIGTALAPFTSSTRFTVPNYWADPATGISYQVQVEVPQYLMHSRGDIETATVQSHADSAYLVRDFAEVKEGIMPGEIDRYNMRRLIGMSANIEGKDLGEIAAKIARAQIAAGAPPAGVQVEVRGQVTPMNELFRSLRTGLAAAVVVILLLLMAYFQSLRLALVAVTAVPAVLCGVTCTLLATGTTLNLQSYMGAIMAVGVAVANAILLVSFAERSRLEGTSALDAAVHGVRARVRPILMTSAAMIAGMIPMAIGFGESGDQTAPLGRAVIGGLLASTAATLLILPAAFALIMGWGGRQSISLDPYDPQSRFFTHSSDAHAPPSQMGTTS